MKIRLDGGLPFVSATVRYAGRSLDVDLVLVDTGSAGSVFSADALDPLRFEPAETDIIRQIRGVGGSEFVYSKSPSKRTFVSITARIMTPL